MKFVMLFFFLIFCSLLKSETHSFDSLFNNQNLLTSKLEPFLKSTDQLHLLVGRHQWQNEKLESQWFSFRDTAIKSGTWYPASTVKFMAALGALVRANELGYERNSTITFLGNTPQKKKLSQLITQAVGPSSNIDYNYLVHAAGFAFIHRQFFSLENGFETLRLNIPYANDAWAQLGFHRNFRVTPKTIWGEHEFRSITYRSQPCSGKYNSTCASPYEISQALLWLYYPQLLPRPYGLRSDDREFLLSVMKSKRSRGEELVDGLKKVLGEEHFNFYHKAGFAVNWFSDAVIIERKGTSEIFTVVAANYPGRASLNHLSAVIGEFIKTAAIFQDSPLE
jgi:hypothetical protein